MDRLALLGGVGSEADLFCWGCLGFPLWAVSSGLLASGRLGAVCCALCWGGGELPGSGGCPVGPAHCCQDSLWFLL